MARRKSNSAAVGDGIFYKWKGETLPGVIVGFVTDAEGGLADLNVFTRNGVMVVMRVAPGNGDAQYSTSASAPAPVAVEDEAGY